MRIGFRVKSSVSDIVKMSCLYFLSGNNKKAYGYICLELRGET